jgi:hypothetical protein
LKLTTNEGPTTSGAPTTREEPNCRTGGRPALQNTREASDDKRGIRRQEETQTRTQTETSLRFEKELAEGQLHRIQEKHQMTRGESEEKRRLRQEHRRREACVLKKSWPKASSTEHKRSFR